MSDWKNLGNMQEEFAYALSDLISWCREQGIRVRLKDAYRDPRVHGAWGTKKGYGAANSVHKVSLAQDIYTKNYSDYSRMHDKWDELGGAPRIAGDINHFSFRFEGHW